MQVGGFVFYGGNRVDAVLCADQGPGDYALAVASVSQLSDECVWYPDHCQYTANATIRYGL